MADEDPSGIIERVLDHVFTGTAADAVIAILVLVIILLCAFLWQIYKRLLEAEKEKTKMSESHQAELKELNKAYHETLKDLSREYHDTLKDLNTSYQDSIQEATTQSSTNSTEVARSLSSVQTALAELKTVVSIISLRGHGHGSPKSE